MADKAAKWQQEFEKTRAATAQVQDELQQWEQLASQSAPAGERAKQGACIRAKVMQLKLDLERHQRALDGLGAQASADEAVRKSLAQHREGLKQAFAELQELQKRSKGSPASASPPVSKSPREAIGLGGPFAKPPGAERQTPPAGAELQPVSQRAMLQQQQQRMRAMDEQAADLEGSVNNLQQVSHMILGEIRSQNTMLDSLNEDTSRVQSRMGRARTMLARVSRTDRNRWLVCGIAALLVALIVLFVYAVGV